MRCALVSIAICLAAVAHADTSAQKKSEAEIIFKEAVKLRDAGQLAEACAKFSKAFDLDEHAVGSLLNVALCDEKAGKVASAFRAFTDAQQRSKEQGLTESQKAAEDHLATLATLVPYVKLTFAEALIDIKVVIDDVVVDPDLEIPLDPGERTMLVTAPGRLPFETKLDMQRGEHKAFTVPALARSVTVKSSRRTIGKIVTLSGASAVVIAVAAGLYANHLWHDQIPFCTGPSGGPYICPPDQHALTDRARLIGDFATVLGGVGLVAIGVGAYLWLRAPTETAPRVSVVPSLTPDSIGLAAAGHF
jgi:hypothetical protein